MASKAATVYTFKVALASHKNMWRQIAVRGHQTLDHLHEAIFTAFDRKPPQEKPWTKNPWVYDLRTSRHFTLKQNPIRRSDFEEFVELFKPGAMHKWRPTWNESDPDGRRRCYDYEELLKRDKHSLEPFQIKNDRLEDSASLPDPDILATEMQCGGPVGCSGAVHRDRGCTGRREGGGDEGVTGKAPANGDEAKLLG